MTWTLIWLSTFFPELQFTLSPFWYNATAVTQTTYCSVTIPDGNPCLCPSLLLQIVCLQNVVFELEAVTDGDTQQVKHSTRPSPFVGGITSSTHRSVRAVTSPTEQHVGDVTSSIQQSVGDVTSPTQQSVGDVTSPVVPLFGNVTKQKKGPIVLALHEQCSAGKVTQSPDYTTEESMTTANSCKDVSVKTCETFGHSELGVKEGTSSLITLLGANGKCREASKLPLDSDSCRRTTKTIQSDIDVAAARQHRDVNAVCTDGKVLKTARALARGPESSKSKQTCKKLLRGQMKFIPEWGQIAFLCTPLWVFRLNGLLKKQKQKTTTNLSLMYILWLCCQQR